MAKPRAEIEPMRFVATCTEARCMLGGSYGVPCSPRRRRPSWLRLGQSCSGPHSAAETLIPVKGCGVSKESSFIGTRSDCSRCRIRRGGRYV